jgi:mitochondrial fusion and transport protein UGO1
MITSTTSGPRAVLPSLRALPSLSLPVSIFPATLLNSIIPTLWSTSTPLVLRSFLGIDSVHTPSAYSVTTFISSLAELFVQLPVETVLRRGQVAVLQEHDRQAERELYTTMRSHPRQAKRDAHESLKPIVNVGPYKGVFGTMWFIVKEEGTSFVGPAAIATGQGQRGLRTTQSKPSKGQGVRGLWRGWRVGFWGVVGLWGVAALNGNNTGEF